jgi:TRAP transporter 4TM/12TM fusion protein
MLAVAARKSMAATIIVLPIAWLTDPAGLFRSLLLFDQIVILELCMAMAVTFWNSGGITSAVKSAPKEWFDISAGGAALLSGIWLTVRFDEFGLGLSMPGAELICLSILLILLVLECTRRVAGLPMTILVIAAASFGFVAQFFDGVFSAPPTGLGDYLAYLAVNGDALLGQALKVIVSVVLVFILFGALFEFAGGSEFVKNLALHFTGSTRGAPVKISVLASGLLGSIVGSTTSNVLTTGNFTIPMMRKIGMPAHQAGAIEAVASTGGQLTPPVMGAAAFLMADIAGLPYTQVVLAALLPSLLYYFSLYVQADRLAARYGLSSGGTARQTGSAALIRDGVIYSIPVMAIIAGLAAYEHAPYWAGLFGSASIAIIGFLRSTSSLSRLWQIIIVAGETSLPIIITGATVGIMIGVVNSTGIGVAFTHLVSEVADTNLFVALVITALAAYVLGMGLATTAVYVMVAILLAPTLIDLGISTMGAHLFVFYTAMLSMITPPVAIACLVASGVAGSSFLKTSLYAMKFGWIKYLLPFLFIYSPEILLEGDSINIILTIITIVSAILLMANASSGFERERLSLLVRLFYTAAALILIVPWVAIEIRAAIAVVAIMWTQRHRLPLWRRLLPAPLLRS